MHEITPRVCIDGRDVDFLDGNYNLAGGINAATLTFKLPLTYGGMKKLWNKEVTFYLNSFDSVPIFRGWIKRTNPTFEEIEIFAEDAIGYMIKGGESGLAKVALTEQSNIDGLTTGAAIAKLITLANLSAKVKTDIIGNTSPSRGLMEGGPIRGTIAVLDVIKELISKSIDKASTLPRPNIIRIVDDGTYSQLIIELENLIDDTATIQHVFTERHNIVDLNIINRKVPTIIIVNGDNDQTGTFTHDSALAAYDRSYLEVENSDMKSPAECKKFAGDIFEANLKLQYEYTMTTFDGAYLQENDVIRIQTEEPEFSCNYRILGKTITLSRSSFAVGLTINRKLPTLAEYISSSDN